MLRRGTVVITGKPNVGKSSLLNALIKREVAITNPKPQTTRFMINHVYNDEKYQIGFIDTPGLHKRLNKLSDFLNNQVKLAYKKACCAIFVIDASRELNFEDEQIIDLLKSNHLKNIILVVNKIDLDSDAVCKNYVARITKKLDVKDVLYISAKNKTNLNKVIETIGLYLDDQPVTITNSEDDDDYIITELIRCEILNLFHQEIPYSTCVEIKYRHYDPKTNVFDIYANLVVEKESQKPIIIGDSGKKIHQLRVNSLAKIRKVFDCKINLHIHIVVRKNWKNNLQLLKQHGYKVD